MVMNVEMEKSKVLLADDREGWEKCFHSLPLSLQDINYSYDYHKMIQENGDGEMRLFFFEQNLHKYYYPFLIRSVDIDGERSIYKDIETAYGYTGPISTTQDPDFIKA